MKQPRSTKDLALSFAENVAPIFLEPQAAIDSARIERVLVTGAGGAGDLMRLVPALTCIRDNFLHARITLLSIPGASDVLDLFGVRDMVHDIVPYDIRGEHRSLSAKLRLVRQLRRRKYDLVYSPDRGIGMREGYLMSAMTGAPHRLGFHRGRIGRTNTIHVPFSDHRPITEQNLDILRAAGLAVNPDVGGMVRLSKEDIDGISAKLGNLGLHSWNRLIIVHPSAAWEGSYRAWPLENYARLITRMIDEFDAHVVVVGTVGEEADCESLMQSVGTEGIVNLSGKTSLRELAALLSLAELLVGNDSGPLNLAAIMEKRFVGVFGPTSPRQVLSQLDTGVSVHQNLPCQPCYLHQEQFAPPCGMPHRPPCLAELPVEAVLSAARQALQQ